MHPQIHDNSIPNPLLKLFKSGWWILGILALTITAYLPVFRAGFTNWDDDIYIVDNLLIRSFTWEQVVQWFTHPFLGLYQPLVLLSLAIDYSINGLDPFVFHLTNLLLHILNTVLVFLFIRNLTGNRPLAGISMALFGLHPIHVEAVAWVTERKEVLYAFFYLSSLNLYLEYLKSQRSGYLVFTFVLFTLSLISKASAVTLPLVFIAVDLYRGRKLISQRVILEKAPFLAAGFLFGMATLVIHRQFGSLANTSGLPLEQRLMLGSMGLMYHLEKIIWPVSLSTLNPTPVNIDRFILLKCLLFGIFYLGIGYLVYRLQKREITFGILFFILTIGFFLVPPGVSVIASERYAYIPSLGLIFSGSWILLRLLEKFRKVTPFLLGFLAVYLSFLSIRTYAQSLTWQSSLALWDHVIHVRGESYRPLLHRGNAYRIQGDYSLAMADFNRSIDLNPRHFRTYDNRGHLLLLLGDYRKATLDFKRSASLNPNSAFAFSSIGFTYRKLNQPDSALLFLQAALKIDPKEPEVYFNIGKINILNGDTLLACQNLAQAVALGLQSENRLESLSFINNHCPE